VEAWPLPFADAELSAEGWPHARAGAPPLAFEVTPVFAQARALLPHAEWLLVASTAVLEAHWAAFYATGDARYVRRIVRDVAPAWAEFAAALPDAVQYVLSLEAPLPEALAMGGGGGGGGGGVGPARSHADALRAVRANVSRVAVWTLLHHTRRHPSELDVELLDCGRWCGTAECDT
jgi:hypothetical protein